MDHESKNIGPPTELPQPQEASAETVSEIGFAPPVEASNMRPSTPAISSQPQDDTTANGPQIPPIGITQNASDDDVSRSSGTLMADDADLIEKEWVIRAKSIVSQTKDDPHTQNREMNKVKADYLKKRYNKDLKISEG